MTKHVLDVGNCPPDYAAVRAVIESNFDAVVLQSHTADDTLAVLAQKPIDLVLVNRKLDHDYTDGLRVIERIKSTAAVSTVPVMMITNFDEHQQQAVRAGAEQGFGKLALDSTDTLEKLRRYLG